jgi:hypothetical protein
LRRIRGLIVGGLSTTSRPKRFNGFDSGSEAAKGLHPVNPDLADEARNTDMASGHKDADELLDRYAAQHAADVKNAQNLLNIDVPDLLSALATRVTTPSAMFATPGDRYGTTTAAGQGTRSGPMVEVGKKVALRCARALHDFICKSDDSGQLREKLVNAIVNKDVSAVGIIAGGLVAIIGMAPAAAAVVAAVIVKVVVIPTTDVLCEQWDGALVKRIDGAARGPGPVAGANG